MLPFLRSEYANPSSAHQAGQSAMLGVDRARREAAGSLLADPSEIFFTSGATESNNLAIQGSLLAWKKGKPKGAVPHVITSSIEHLSVLNSIKYLEKSQQVSATYLRVSEEGIVAPDDVAAALRDSTALVSIMAANNEVGTVQPIREISNVLRDREALLHCDAAQAPSYMDSTQEALGADMISFSAHKIYGPKGAGLLYVREGTPIDPLFYGGSQQDGLRPGTIPAFLAIGMATALGLAADQRSQRSRHAKELSEHFLGQLSASLPEVRLNGSATKRLPNNVHVSFPWGDSESTLMALDLEGVAVSTGSACSSGSIRTSHVLRAMGIPEKLRPNSIRITFGKDNTKKDADLAVEALTGIARRISPSLG